MPSYNSTPLMTKRDATRLFKENILPGVKILHEQDGKPDWPARSESWSFFVDSLEREGEISPKQFANWLAPRVCTRQERK